MSRPRKLWGEIPEKENPNPRTPDVSADIVKSMSTFLTDSQAQEEIFDDVTTEHVILDPMNPIIMYTISLQKYLNDITEKIKMVESNISPANTEAPLIPEEPEVNLVKKARELIKIPEISNAVAQMILKKCVAVLVAHIGFETTSNNILLFLTDILEDFLIKFCRRLRTASEEDLAGFPSYPEKVLTEFGFDGFKGLHDYHENRVVRYSKILKERCEELREVYVNLLPDNVIQIREEDVFEVHFPRIDEDVGFSSLETGFQLLNSLEAGTNMWETEEAMEVEGGLVQASDGINQVFTENIQE